MSAARPIRKPVQMSLFEQRTLSVSRVAERLGCSRDTVLRLIEEDVLKAYRLTLKGWYRVFEWSLLEYEQKLLREYALGAPQDAEKRAK
jgi:excisionase family DNA binding protein